MNARRKKYAACAAGGLCIAMLLAGAMLLPQADSNGMPTVVLSHESGFYDEPFDLELSFDGGTIHYTLDSTDPDENAALYEGPIRIEDASANPNVYAVNTDVSLELNPDLLEEYGLTQRFGYRVPEHPVDKATVVRAVGIDADGNRSEVVTGVYFIGYREKTGYEGLGIMAITTNPRNLFGSKKGIYVLGRTFRDAADKGALEGNRTVYETWPANYNERGRQWERQASICCFDANRNLVFSGDYGIRIQGGVSRGMLPKSLNLFARKDYGSALFSGADLFGVNWQLDSVTLTGGSLSYKAKVHDAMINLLATGLAIDTRVYRPYEMFLDGEYWGVYWLTPRYGKEYFQYRYGVKGDDVVMIKQGGVEIGEKSDAKLYKQMRNFICGHDMSDPEAYAKACEMIDIHSCVDYYATEIYISNMDWPNKNTALWRTRNTSSGAYGDGRWRWILYDVNIAMIPKRAGMDYVNEVRRSDKLFASLMKNSAFSEAFYNRLLTLAENQFNPSRVETWLRDYEVSMTDAIENDYARFYNDSRPTSVFIDTCEKYIRYYRDRYDYIYETYGPGRRGEG